MSDEIVVAAQARLAGGFPGWHDATGAAHPTPEEKLPAYAVRVTYSDAERLGMADPRAIREGQIEVSLEVAAATEAEMHGLASQLAQAILAPPSDLGGLVWDMLPGGFEADHDPGAQSISKGELLIPIQTIE